MKVRHCCLCVPLRAGLLIWGYFAVVIIYINILYVLYQLQVLWTSNAFDSNQFIYRIFGLLLIALYFILHVVLISGLHNKSSGLLSVYKGFISVTMIFEGIVASLYIPISMFQMYQEGDNVFDYTTSTFTRLMRFLFFATVSVFSVFMFKVYLLVCVRSMKSTFEKKEVNESERLANNSDVTVTRQRSYDSDA